VVVAAMKDVREAGLAAGRHLRGDIYEVRADGDRQTYRILFAPEGRRRQILLALEGFSKKTQKTPPRRSGLLRGGLLTGGAEARLNLSDEMPSTL
jgi:phage-related protein